MKKALLLILAIVAMCFLIANVDYLSEFFNTMLTGALVPMIVAIVLMLGRHLVQAASYDAAFEAVGHKTGFWHNVILIFSLVFINTFCLFSGATGVAFIIDDAHREGCDAGQSTGGAILSQIGYFAAVFVISVIGFLTMLVSGHMNTVFLVGGLLLAGVLLVLSSLFFVGHFRPRVLYRIFLLLEKALNKLMGVLHRSLKAGWGRQTARSFVTTSNLLAQNPSGTFITVAYASLSAILNMACLIAIGYAFGFENVESLVAAFAVGAISVILSPTPQGIGVVEALIAGILTAYGCSVATAAAIALVYRGVMFWMPFVIGAVLLSQSGFFKGKKSPTEMQRHKDIAWISGTLVFIIGLVNIMVALAPDVLTPYTMLTSWFDMSSLLVGIPLIVGSVFLMACAVGLVFRFRTAWAVTIAALVCVAGTEFLFQGTWRVAIAMLVLMLWMFWKRDAFDRPFSRDAIRHDIDAWKQRREKRIAHEAAKTSGTQRMAAANAEAGSASPATDSETFKSDEPAPCASATENVAESWEEQAERGKSIGERVIEETQMQADSRLD